MTTTLHRTLSRAVADVPRPLGRAINTLPPGWTPRMQSRAANRRTHTHCNNMRTHLHTWTCIWTISWVWPRGIPDCGSAPD